MKHDLFINRMIFIVSLVLAPLAFTGLSFASAPEEGASSFSQKQVKGLEQIAAESVLDTLKACLSRIPSNASAGQLLLAEQNCRQIEAERNTSQLTF